MSKKTLLLLTVAFLLIVGVGIFVFRTQPKSSLSNPIVNQPDVIKTQPSETVKIYSDASGFSFSYPDNLSLVKNETTDPSSYADLKLTASGVEGSLNIKITDSKFSTLDDWIKSNYPAALPGAKEVKLGDLKAKEIKVNDKLLVAALDKGVLFTLEIPLQQDFWIKVEEKVLAEFSFAPVSDTTSSGNSDSSPDAVSFEGEEVVQ